MSRHITPPFTRGHARIASLAAVALFASLSCGAHDSAPVDTTRLMPAPADGPAAGPAAARGAAGAPVRGTITAISDTALTVATDSGTRQLSISGALRVYARVASDLAHVTPNAFVGITSVAQPDGSQRATEIHIFPEELRGMGEGSRMMQEAAPGRGPSTMTNGSVSSPSRMTNGNVAGSRMTNGNVSAAPGGGTRYTVQYQGGTQAIDVPAGVTVTAIAPTQVKPAIGANVVVITTVGPGGRPSVSAIMLSTMARPNRRKI